MISFLTSTATGLFFRVSPPATPVGSSPSGYLYTYGPALVLFDLDLVLDSSLLKTLNFILFCWNPNGLGA